MTRAVCRSGRGSSITLARMNTRRTFLSRLGISASTFGAALGLAPSSVQGQSATDSRFQPARHEQDDWFDKVPGTHRCFFDTATSDELIDAIQFCNNYMTANRT